MMLCAVGIPATICEKMECATISSEIGHSFPAVLLSASASALTLARRAHAAPPYAGVHWNCRRRRRAPPGTAARRRDAPPGGLSVGSLAASYGAALSTSPILTKSVTAGAIFGLSDATAQSLDTPSEGRDWARTAVSCLVGLCYFGPAAHAWYDTVFRLFPEGGVKSTLIKSALGQMFFGPTFTCVFFLASLVAVLGLRQGLASWPGKIRQDLVATWAAGLGFWPFVDLVSYGFIPAKWIPLFVNSCSFVWTIYLSLQAAKTVD